MPSRPPLLMGAAALGLCIAAPATAVPVTFDGLVLQSCILTVSTPGVLGVSAESGKVIGSEEVGGVPAVLTIVATAGAPTITVAAPTMSQKPAAYGGTPAVSVRYTSPGGANQAYTSGSSSYTSSNLLGDTLTLNAKAQDNDGFPAGSYRLQTNVTCQQ